MPPCEAAGALGRTGRSCAAKYSSACAEQWKNTSVCPNKSTHCQKSTSHYLSLLCRLSWGFVITFKNCFVVSQSQQEEGRGFNWESAYKISGPRTGHWQKAEELPCPWVTRPGWRDPQGALVPQAQEGLEAASPMLAG